MMGINNKCVCFSAYFRYFKKLYLVKLFIKKYFVLVYKLTFQEEVLQSKLLDLDRSKTKNKSVGED